MTLEQRVAALEQAVAALTSTPRASAGPAASHPSSSVVGLEEALGAAMGGELFVLDELRQRFPDGAVAFAGHAEVADGPVAWQWGRPTRDLLERDWDSSATPLAALGHPVRLRLLQLVLTGTQTTADLAHDPDLGTTGQLHHHLRTLIAAGWLATAGRGRYTVPPQRIVPLLVIITATES